MPIISYIVDLDHLHLYINRGKSSSWSWVKKLDIAKGNSRGQSLRFSSLYSQ